jgi:hypothetical protein
MVTADLSLSARQWFAVQDENTAPVEIATLIISCRAWVAQEIARETMAHAQR